MKMSSAANGNNVVENTERTDANDRCSPGDFAKIVLLIRKVIKKPNDCLGKFPNSRESGH